MSDIRKYINLLENTSNNHTLFEGVDLFSEEIENLYESHNYSSLFIIITH